MTFELDKTVATSGCLVPACGRPRGVWPGNAPAVSVLCNKHARLVKQRPVLACDAAGCMNPVLYVLDPFVRDPPRCGDHGGRTYEMCRNGDCLDQADPGGPDVPTGLCDGCRRNEEMEAFAIAANQELKKMPLAGLPDELLPEEPGIPNEPPCAASGCSGLSLPGAKVCGDDMLGTAIAACAARCCTNIRAAGKALCDPCWAAFAIERLEKSNFRIRLTIPEWLAATVRSSPCATDPDPDATTEPEEDPMAEPAKKQAILKTLELDAGDAGTRLAGKQFVRLARDPVVALLSRHLGPDDPAIRARVAAFLDTELGGALLASVLSVGLAMLPAGAGDLPKKLSRELRVGAMTDAGDVIAELLMGPLRAVASLYIQGGPAVCEDHRQLPNGSAVTTPLAKPAPAAQPEPVAVAARTGDG